MRTKICVLIDSDLLDIIKKISDSDLDSIVQDSLAQFFGLKQIWITSNTMQPIAQIKEKDTQNIQKLEEEDVQNIQKLEEEDIQNIQKSEEEKPKEKSKKGKKRKPTHILKIWNDIKGVLNDEFTNEDYWNATKKLGMDYKKSARYSTILLHLKLIEDAGKIELISQKPKIYRKVEKTKKIEVEKSSLPEEEKKAKSKEPIIPEEEKTESNEKTESKEPITPEEEKIAEIEKKEQKESNSEEETYKISDLFNRDGRLIKREKEKDFDEQIT